MNVQRSETGELWPGHLLIGTLPVLIICGTDWLLNLTGTLLPTQPTLDPAGAAPHLELAARLRIATTYLLLIFAAAAASAYFIVIARDADRRSLWMTLGAGALSVLAVHGYFEAVDDPQTQTLVGQKLYCEATNWPGSQAQGQPAAPARTAGSSQAAVVAPSDGPDLNDPANCTNERFHFIRNRIDTQRHGLAIGIPAVVFGAILCLRRRRNKPETDDEAEPGAEAEAEARHLQVQINRLNTILYLTAFLLVSGLLFLAAFLHYPGYGLAEEPLKQLGKAVQAIVLYYAVSYSLLIASFYLPVAAILAHRCEGVRHPEVAEASKSGIMAPVQMLKVAFAILSPLLAGIVTEVVKLPGG